MKHWLVLFLLAAVCSQALAKPEVFTQTLPNGMMIIVKPDTRAPVVVSQLWYRVGSSYEHGGITGVSHALEHMMFKGTTRFPGDAFNQLIAENGGQNNAFTSSDYTVYFQKLSADRLPVALKLEADRMQNLIFSNKDFVKEIEVVKEERRMRYDDNPQNLTYERFNAAAHISNPYHHLTIGWMNDLKNMKMTDLSNWYKQWYAPNNATLVVVGDVDPDAVFALAKKYFAKLKHHKVPLVKPQREPKSIGERSVKVNLPAQLPIILIGFNTPSLVNIKQPQEAYALELLTSVLDGGASSRFSRELIRGKQLASSASAGYDLYDRFDGLFTLSGIPAKGHTLADLQTALLAQIKRVQTQLVDRKELQRIITQVVASKVYERDNLFGQAFSLGQAVTVGLPWQTADEYLNRIKAVTPEQLQQAAKKYLIADNMTIATLNPLPMKGKARPQPLKINGAAHVH